jgi:hypothetical protein
MVLRIALRASRAQPIPILRSLIEEANPARSAATRSSESPYRTAAPTSAPDADLLVTGSDMKAGSGGT